ncbi:hypothetical protein QWY93_17020 [Echinicola jeungdonensis]|uniref:Septum formation inhibitor Maf n=1 Tax=Echinicola jeungdonensis TaxID=709343 RepID=A0ABV5J5M6_9BACT|nr:hypothetical protein [Echinicola jeungdonensis]MDN3671018.1 hypothetical protein [Echinicola jeungdonensis]
MKKEVNFLVILASLWSLMSCNQFKKREMDFDRFGEYWFQGKAEINAFDLVQYRYGEPRKGEAVLVFVTEPFSKSKQVKLDHPENAIVDEQTVMKMNLTKDFVTGIYPYHMMMSTFTPVFEKHPSVKVNASSQEWCGHTFSQLNWKDGEYQSRLFSYFESEGDYQRRLEGMPESEIWNLIRINPEDIPEGEILVIPDLLNLRMTHKEMQGYKATCHLSPLDNGISVLRLEYNNYNRKLEIGFDSKFPFEIYWWEEIKEKENGKDEITRAERKGQLITPYWKQNGSKYLHLRDSLNLK